jgi:D-alanyl-D-alanine dipeptidase
VKSTRLTSAAAELLDRPIPRGAIRSTAQYRTVPVDTASRHVDEPLVLVGDYGIASESYYARADGFNPPYGKKLAGADPRVRVRLGVARRLRSVNRRIRPYGVELLVLDGYRSLACQRSLWKHFINEARMRLGRQSPDQIERYALEFCADPRGFRRSDSRTWPTHMTGGAVDLTLKQRRGPGGTMFMGGVFDDPSEVSHTNYFERGRRARLPLSHREARKNRRLLYWSMTGEGFANISTEWWHYDWGTQLWAYVEGATRGHRTFAVYGPA